MIDFHANHSIFLPVKIEDGLDYETFAFLQKYPSTILPNIARLIFNDPATIVYWDDGTKTVVKCQPGDTFSKETGLMAAMLKRFLGNDNSYNKIINHWLTTATQLSDFPRASKCHEG